LLSAQDVQYHLRFVSSKLGVCAGIQLGYIVERLVFGIFKELVSTETVWADPQDEYTRSLLAAIPRI